MVFKMPAYKIVMWLGLQYKLEFEHDCEKNVLCVM